MGRFIFVVQQKGGSGKTFLAVHLKSFLDAQGVRFRPVDLDHEADLISSIYPKDTLKISPSVLDLQQGTSILPSAFELLIKKQESAIFDTGANIGEIWDVLLETCPALLSDLPLKGFKVTLVIPVDAHQRSRDCFERYRKQWAGATVILAVVRAYKNHQFPLPPHPENQTFELPLAPPALFETYRGNAMTMDAILASTDPKLAVAAGFARGYLPKLHAEFRRLLPHLLP